MATVPVEAQQVQKIRGEVGPTETTYITETTKNTEI